jgi:hypothetical protein
MLPKNAATPSILSVRDLLKGRTEEKNPVTLPQAAPAKPQTPSTAKPTAGAPKAAVFTTDQSAKLTGENFQKWAMLSGTEVSLQVPEGCAVLVTVSAEIRLLSNKTDAPVITCLI